MKHIRFLSVFIAAALVIALAFSSCANATAKGKWHTDIDLNTIKQDSMSDQEKLILSMIVGDFSVGIDLTLNDDKTFSYVIDTDGLAEKVSEKINGAIGLFTDYDASEIVNNIVSYAADNFLPKGVTTLSGKYTDDGGRITTDSTPKLNFIFEGGKLIQTDDSGNKLLEFKRV